jgi:hypothetical protein
VVESWHFRGLSRCNSSRTRRNDSRSNPAIKNRTLTAFREREGGQS